MAVVRGAAMRAGSRSESLEDLFEEIAVSKVGHGVAGFVEATGPAELFGWFAVHDADACLAFFQHEHDTYAFRLWLCNLRCNGDITLARYRTGPRRTI